MDVSKQYHKLNDLTETDPFRKQEPAEEEKKPSEDRIVLLTDGIFAIAVTLLVLDIKIPDNTYTRPDQAHQAQIAFVTALTGDFLAHTQWYIITFLVLASYWLAHRRLMNIVKRVDVPFLWLNLLFLAFVAFFPVTTSIVKYGNVPEAVIAYTFILAGCGYSAMLLWIYAITNHRLIAADIPTEKYKNRIIAAAITPTFFLASLFLLFIPHITPSYIFYSWLLLPFIQHVFRIFKRTDV